MPIDVGDAVLHFLGDTTQLDQAFNQVATEAGAKMGVATSAVQGTTGAVKELSTEMAVGQQGAVALGEITTLAGEQTRASMYEARGEIGLLGEEFGIHLPRHVRSFVAELPGVAKALTAAFEATALLFLIQALIEGTEKLSQWAASTFIFTDAMKKANESTIAMNEQLVKHSDHLAKLKDDYLLLGLSGVAKTNEQMVLLRKEMAENAKGMDELQQKALAGNSQAQSDFIVRTSIARELQQELTNLAKQGAQERVKELQKERDEQEKMVIADLKNEKEKADSLSLLKLQENRAWIAEQGELLGRETALQDQYHQEQYEHERTFLTQKLQIAQLSANQNLKLIADLNTQIENLDRAHAAAGLKEQAEQTLLTAKAVDALTQAEDKLGEAQTRLKEAEITAQFKAQETAITQLANFRIISETQKAHALESLYQQEENAAIKALKDQLAKEQALVDAAQAKLTAAQGNPFFSKIQLLELQKNLDDAQIKVVQTQTKVEVAQTQFQSKMLAHDKGFYGQSLALAIASGNQLLAEKLKENHAALLAAQAQLAEAKARGLNTAAIDKQIQELKKLEKELGNEAQRMKGASKAVVEFTDTMKAAYAEEAQAFAAASEAMITGQQSFGQAMEAATLKMLGNMAKHWADYYIAKGLGNLADMNYGAAAGDFAAAAAFEIIAGLLSGLGSNVGSSGSGGGGGDHPNVDANNPNNQPAQNPVPGGRNVPHLAGGGLITSPTLAMIGDGPSAEAVIPLNDSGVMEAIGAAIARHSEGGSGGMNFYVKGLISPDSLGKVMKRMSRASQTGRGRLLATNSHKLTRRA